MAGRVPMGLSRTAVSKDMEAIFVQNLTYAADLLSKVEALLVKQKLNCINALKRGNRTLIRLLVNLISTYEPIQVIHRKSLDNSFLCITETEHFHFGRS